MHITSKSNNTFVYTIGTHPYRNIRSRSIYIHNILSCIWVADIYNYLGNKFQASCNFPSNSLRSINNHYHSI
jgi:hypothetical protein